jgi:protein involved in polysaccharide export with SLBB domain
MKDLFPLLRKVSVLSTIVSAVLFIAACTPPPKQAMAFDKPATPPAITLMAGDVLSIKFYYTPEMNDTQTVRPDGKISLQLLGDVAVAGKTTEQVRQELITAYSGHLKNPDVVVIVRSMNERRIYVCGEVTRPGAQPLPGSLTVLEAVMDAGGFITASAKPQNVVIIRRSGDTWTGKAVDLSKPLAGNAVALCELQPRDIVFVPRTSISHVDQWIDQHINKVIPSIVNSATATLFSAEFYQYINTLK